MMCLCTSRPSSARHGLSEWGAEDQLRGGTRPRGQDLSGQPEAGVGRKGPTLAPLSSCLRVPGRADRLREVREMEVFVRNNDVNAALRVLKKKMQREGTFREMKLRRSYEKPSERRVREKAESIRRYRKMLRKRLEQEGY